jgi:hypothetical protein
LAVPGHEDIRRLDVAMSDALRVRRVDSVRNLNAEIKQRISLQWLASDAVLERLPLQQFHSDERLTLKLVYVVNRADVGMIEGARGTGLALEAFQHMPVGNRAFGQELESQQSSNT